MKGKITILIAAIIIIGAIVGGVVGGTVGKDHPHLQMLLLGMERLRTLQQGVQYDYNYNCDPEYSAQGVGSNINGP
jgi:hypothetical protein